MQQSPSIRRPGRGDFATLLLMSAMWGSSFMAIKVAIQDVPPITVAALRIVLAAAALLVYLRVMGHRLPSSPRIWWFFTLIGFFNCTLPFILIPWGEGAIDSGHAAILMASGPLMALFMGHFATRDDRFTLFKLIGVVIGFAGVVVVIGLGALGGEGDSIWRQLAVMAAAGCYGVAGTITRRVRGVAADVLTTGVVLSSAVTILPVSLFVDQPWTLTPSQATVWALLWLGLFPTAIAYVLRFRLIGLVGYTFVSFGGYLVPVFGVLWGVALLSEPVTAATLGGLGLILAGVFLSRLGPQR